MTEHRKDRGAKPSIAKATRQDLSLLFGLIRELAEFEKIPHEVVGDEATLGESLFGDRPAAEAIIARVDGEPAGFCVFFQNFSTFVARPGLYIEDLFVRPKFRGAGVGKALFMHCAGVAAERRLGRIEFAVLDWNPARGFYERHGARPLKDWILYRISGETLRRLADS